METGLFSPSTRINFGKLFPLEIIYFIWGSKFVYIKLYKIVSFFFFSFLCSYGYFPYAPSYCVFFVLSSFFP